MFLKKFSIFTLSFLSILLFLGCSKKDANSVSPGSATIIGDWTRTKDDGFLMTFTFTEDNKYEADFEGDSEKDVWGSYSISGNQITFNDEGGAFHVTPGVYNYALTADQLAFTVTDDTGEGRKEAIIGTWSRKI